MVRLRAKLSKVRVALHQASGVSFFGVDTPWFVVLNENQQESHNSGDSLQKKFYQENQEDHRNLFWGASVTKSNRTFVQHSPAPQVAASAWADSFWEVGSCRFQSLPDLTREPMQGIPRSCQNAVSPLKGGTNLGVRFGIPLKRRHKIRGGGTKLGVRFFGIPLKRRHKIRGPFWYPP